MVVYVGEVWWWWCALLNLPRFFARACPHPRPFASPGKPHFYDPSMTSNLSAEKLYALMQKYFTSENIVLSGSGNGINEN